MLYLASVAAETGMLATLRMVPMQASRLRLRHASAADSEGLRSVLEKISSRFGCRVSRLPDGVLVVRPTPDDMRLWPVSHRSRRASLR